MIDRRARTAFAENLRHLLTGQITNDQYEDRLIYSDDSAIDSHDSAIEEVHWTAAWHLYSDLHEHRLTGKHAIAPEERSTAARLLLFLKTDFEYEWPSATGCLGCLLFPLNLLTLGLIGELRWRTWSRLGDREVWPFRWKEDFEHAKAQRIYLRGKR